MHRTKEDNDILDDTLHTYTVRMSNRNASRGQSLLHDLVHIYIAKN